MYSEAQSVAHYDFLKKTMNFFSQGGIIFGKLDIEEHCAFIIKMFEYFPELDRINIEIDDKGFRKLAYDSYYLLQGLAYEIKSNRTFNQDNYKLFMFNIYKIYKFIISEDELLALFGNISL